MRPLARILDRKRPEKRIADALHLVEPDESRIEDVGHELALDVDRIRFVQPHVKWSFHRGFAAALIVLELVNDDRVSVQQPLIERMLGDDCGVGNYRRIANVFHTAEVRFVHADGPVESLRCIHNPGSCRSTGKLLSVSPPECERPFHPGRNKIFDADFTPEPYSTASMRSSHVPAPTTKRYGAIGRRFSKVMTC